MHFDLVDRVLERSEDRIVTIKQVSASEEYLQDHFPAFPVLPGVFMIESLVQAARRLVEDRTGTQASAADPEAGRSPRLVLGSVRAVKYGSFVRPGETLRVEVELTKSNPDGSFDFRGEGTVIRFGESGEGVNVHDPSTGTSAPPTAVSGKFSLRPPRIHT